jgi:hypothetical protein
MISKQDTILLEDAYLFSQLGGDLNVIAESIELVLTEPLFLKEFEQQLELDLGDKKASKSQQMKKIVQDAANKINSLYPKNKKAMSQALPKFFNKVSKELGVPPNQISSQQSLANANQPSSQQQPVTDVNQSPSSSTTSDVVDATSQITIDPKAKPTSKEVSRIFKELKQVPGLYDAVIKRVLKNVARRKSVQPQQAPESSNSVSSPESSNSTPSPEPSNSTSSESNAAIVASNSEANIQAKLNKKKGQTGQKIAEGAFLHFFTEDCKFGQIYKTAIE